MAGYQSRLSVVLRLIIGLLCSMLSTSYAQPYFDDIGYSVLPRHSSKVSFILQTIAVIIMYEIQYFGIAYAFEINHPKNAFSGKQDKETKERMRIVKYSAYYSGINIILMATYAMVHIRYIEPMLPYYGYWQDPSKRYTIYHFFKEMLMYMFFFDTWFYFTHRMLHCRRFLGFINFWSTIHSVHHDIVDPNAFSQDATHPFEAVIQGPAGHHTINYLAPIHPVCHSLFGFLTSIFAIAAHDSRKWDVNGHQYHHKYCHVNFGIYWGFWDYIFGTRYGQKNHKKLTKWGQDPWGDDKRTKQTKSN